MSTDKIDPLNSEDAHEPSSLPKLPFSSLDIGEFCSIKLKLPQFWERSPVPWFVQAEAQFALNRITGDTTKFHHVISALPQSAIESVLDFLENPPNTDLYKNLKKLLIDRHSLSESKRIERLLSGEQLGYRKPSDFYRALKQLAGSSGAISEPLIRNLWLRRLPQAVNVALVSFQDKDITDLISIADKIFEVLQLPQVSTVSLPSTSNSQSNLEKEVHELKAMVKQLSSSRQSRSRTRNSTPHFSDRSSTSRLSHRSKSNHRSDWCWYHNRYKNQAQKCQGSCSFKTSSKNNISKNNNTKN